MSEYKYNKHEWHDGDLITEDALNEMEDGIFAAIQNLAAMTQTSIEYAKYHLGFYLDENGDLCQIDNEEEEEEG